MLPKFIFQDIHKEQQTKQTFLKPSNILKLRQPIKKKEGVQLTIGTQHVLLTSFAMLILGKPGSGKSHFINQIIDQQSFYKCKFDRILYIGPTRYPNCIQDQYNTINFFDSKFIDKKIKECQGWAQNMLIIMDDVISQVPSSQKNQLQQLFFNRRHQLKNGTISIIITSQKLTSVPTWIRSTVNSIVAFAVTKNQLKNLFNQIPLLANSQQVRSAFQNLGKHNFIFMNLQEGKAFDSNFNQI